MENKGVITMQQLLVGDYLETDGLFDKSKKLYFQCTKVHPIWSRPDSNGEVKLENIRYVLKQIKVSYEQHWLIDRDQVGTDVYLIRRVHPSGLIQEFRRP
jgi:hypothetical protein